MLQLRAGARLFGSGQRVMHVIEILDEAYKKLLSRDRQRFQLDEHETSAEIQSLWDESIKLHGECRYDDALDRMRRLETHLPNHARLLANIGHGLSG